MNACDMQASLWEIGSYKNICDKVQSIWEISLTKDINLKKIKVLMYSGKTVA